MRISLGLLNGRFPCKEPKTKRSRLRRLKADHLDRMYEGLLRPDDGRKPLSPKTVLEIHLIIRGALTMRSSEGS